MDPLNINLGSISVFSQYAVSAARKYVDLVEAQITQAHADMSSSALEEYKRRANLDETDYDNYVTIVDRMFEEDYLPILRFTEVIYVYMVFETYASGHIAEIQNLRRDKLDILKTLKSKNKCGLVDAARIYFKDVLHWSLLNDGEWVILREIAEVRNCIVHNAGIVRDSKHRDMIYNLAKRTWRKQSVGIEIDHFQGKDIGQPIIIHQRFLAFCLDLLERFFNALIKETHDEFWKKK